ncbi:ATP-binding protein [Halostella litorea]|uniref:ATP-binding protein n=1 Tax=Halostella litorea TaxID=2528831 RepID=UPI0013870354|nr:ATP-binding protein [Halostella litorea]
MNSDAAAAYASWLLSAVGAVLFSAAVVQHLLLEPVAIGSLRGPLLALALDGTPALVLVYGGRRLARTDLSPERRLTVVVWCVVGAAAALSVMGVSVLIREFEGRAVAEPAFTLLLAADTGAIGGAVAGYYSASAREDAERANRATATLSFVNELLRHDVRNGLAVVDGLALELENETDGDGMATAIRDQAEETRAVIENVGAIAEALGDDPDFEAVDLVPIAAETSDRVGDAFRVGVETDLPERAPVVGNAALRSVVRNLVENAAEHNDTDDLRIRVAVENGDDAVTLRVADDGSGIPDDEKRSVFEPSAGSEHGGGLHMVDTLVDRYGGRLWVEDNEPSGTVFVAELPAA